MNNETKEAKYIPYKPQFISTDYDMQQVRREVVSFLERIKNIGGPESIYYEDFLKYTRSPEDPTAINECFHHAKNVADSCIVIIGKSAGSRIPSEDGLSGEIKAKMTSIIERANRKHILSCLKHLPSSVAWGEAIYIKEINRNPMDIIVHSDSYDLAKEYSKIAKLNKKSSKNKILIALTELFSRDKYSDLKEWNFDKLNKSHDAYIIKMVTLCEYVLWAYELNTPASTTWSSAQEAIDFVKRKYSWAETISSSSCFWVDDQGELLEYVSKLDAQLQGEILVWNSDLRILRNAEWVRDFYLPNSGKYLSIKIAISEAMLKKIKEDKKLRSDLTYVNGLLKENNLESKIEICVFDNHVPTTGTVTSIFGVNNKEQLRKKMAVLSPQLIDCAADKIKVSTNVIHQTKHISHENTIIKDLSAKIEGIMEDMSFCSLSELLA